MSKKTKKADSGGVAALFAVGAPLTGAGFVLTCLLDDHWTFGAGIALTGIGVIALTMAFFAAANRDDVEPPGVGLAGMVAAMALAFAAFFGVITAQLGEARDARAAEEAAEQARWDDLLARLEER